jgi:NAD(P)-dependent dehydrogenase (short-subunit alcohol dehydrogenase family)
MMQRPTICFTTQDLELFSAASHDRNPLHISEQYAHTTPYGEPVVFGILGALAALGHLPDRQSMVLASVSLEFRNPMAVAVNYRIEVAEVSAQQSVAKIYDGERLMMKATFTFLPWRGCSQQMIVSECSCPTEAVDRKREDFTVGSRVTGIYAPSADDLEKVMERWGLSAKGAVAWQIAAMMWASFIVGMELPGKRAIFWRLALDINSDDDGRRRGPLSYAVGVKGFDERLDLLHTTGELFLGNQLFATAQMWAFVRPDSPQPSIVGITALLPRSELLKGKVALVIGGSRGLGAAISQALALQGCSVLLNYRQSKVEAEQTQANLEGKSSLIELAQGDASDIRWCRKLREHILKEYKGLDFLVCNASPPIRALSFVPEKLERFQDFIAKSLALVSVPMSMFLNCLSERSGWNVVVSSAFVRDLPGEWPHYVTAKCAVEGLAHWAAGQYPQTRSLIVRPPKLLTDQTNTTMGRQGAMAVEQAAAAIVKHLRSSAPSRSVQVLDNF